MLPSTPPLTLPLPYLMAFPQFLCQMASHCFYVTYHSHHFYVMYGHYYRGFDAKSADHSCALSHPELEVIEELDKERQHLFRNEASPGSPGTWLV